MLANNNGSQSFNSFKYLDEFPYKIFEYLATSTAQEAENLWKCLKYNDKDCLEKDNLTYEEKLNLIWNGDSDTQDYRVFNTIMLPNSLDESKEMTQIRLYEKQLIPTNQYNALVLFEIDIFTNDKTNALYNERGVLVEKTSYIQNSCLLPLLNGIDLGIGYNYLRFDRETSRGSQSMIGLSNSKSWYGRYFVLALDYSEVDSGGDCFEY